MLAMLAMLGFYGKALCRTPLEFWSSANRLAGTARRMSFFVGCFAAIFSLPFAANLPWGSLNPNWAIVILSAVVIEAFLQAVFHTHQAEVVVAVEKSKPQLAPIKRGLLELAQRCRAIDSMEGTVALLRDIRQFFTEHGLSPHIVEGCETYLGRLTDEMSWRSINRLETARVDGEKAASYLYKFSEKITADDILKVTNPALPTTAKAVSLT